MTKLEEVIAKYNYDNDSFLSIESMMRDYAEIYAKKCLEIAAEEATARLHSYDEPMVNKSSILNIKLPEHD